MSIEHLERAILILGGQTALASEIGVKQGNVWWWLNRSKRVPPGKVIAIESATRGFVTRFQLRPDIYPPVAESTAPQSAHSNIPANPSQSNGTLP